LNQTGRSDCYARVSGGGILPKEANSSSGYPRSNCIGPAAAPPLAMAHAPRVHHRAGIAVLTCTPRPLGLVRTPPGLPQAGLWGHATRIRAPPAPHEACESTHGHPFARARYATTDVNIGRVVLHSICGVPHDQEMGLHTRPGAENKPPQEACGRGRERGGETEEMPWTDRISRSIHCNTCRSEAPSKTAPQNTH